MPHLAKDIAIIGAGATKVDSHVDKLETDLLSEAFKKAIEDSGIKKEDIDGMVFTLPRYFIDQVCFGGFFTQGYLGMSADIVEAYNAGTTSGVAFKQGVRGILSDDWDTCVVLGVNKESHTSTPDHMANFVSHQFDRDYQAWIGATWVAVNGAMVCQGYMEEYGANRKQIASVAVRSRDHASKNPLAHYRDPITLRDVLESKLISDPIRLLECARRDDGAVALVLTNMKKTSEYSGSPVRVKGLGEYNDPHWGVSEKLKGIARFPASNKASEEAYEAADIRAQDLDVINIYAPFTPLDVCILEELGIFERGKAAEAVSEGKTHIGAEKPTCTGGGMLSLGHPVHVSGLYNIYETVVQLRGEADKRQVKGAELGLSHSMHGAADGATVEILERVD